MKFFRIINPILMLAWCCVMFVVWIFAYWTDGGGPHFSFFDIMAFCVAFIMPLIFLLFPYTEKPEVFLTKVVIIGMPLFLIPYSISSYDPDRPSKKEIAAAGLQHEEDKWQQFGRLLNPLIIDFIKKYPDRITYPHGDEEAVLEGFPGFVKEKLDFLKNADQYLAYRITQSLGYDVLHPDVMPTASDDLTIERILWGLRFGDGGIVDPWGDPVHYVIDRNADMRLEARGGEISAKSDYGNKYAVALLLHNSKRLTGNMYQPSSGGYHWAMRNGIIKNSKPVQHAGLVAFEDESPSLDDAGETEPDWSQVVKKHEETTRYDVPITFYGRVVDQDGNPVWHARVLGTTTKVKDFSVDELLEGKVRLVTDSVGEDTGLTGTFRLGGQRYRMKGRLLEIEIEKYGYDSPPKAHFVYDPERQDVLHRPDPRNPVVFVLHRNEEPYDSRSDRVTFNIEGFDPERIYTVDLLENRAYIGVSELGDLVVEAHNEGRGMDEVTQRPVRGHDFKWSVALRMPGGGLIDSGEKLNWPMPKEGYQETIGYRSPKAKQELSPDLKRQYFFFRNKEGQRGSFLLGIYPRADGDVTLYIEEIQVFTDPIWLQNDQG